MKIPNLQEKPYKLEIKINSNADEDDNHLKMMVILEVPHDYPNQNIPFMRIKNLSPDFLDNRTIDEYEQQIREVARENLGMQMIFTICEHLREQISNINEKVLDKYNQIKEAQRAKDEEDNLPMTSNVDHLTYTPVNKETFSKWCK